MKRTFRIFGLLLVVCGAFALGGGLAVMMYGRPGASDAAWYGILTGAGGASSGAGGDHPADEPSNGAPGDLARKVSEIGALGYLAGTRPAGEETGVTRCTPELTWPGLNLYIAGKSPAAYLMDMEGTVLHSWKLGKGEIEAAFPEGAALLKDQADVTRRYWRRCRLRAGGDLLVIYDGGFLARIDKDSNILWGRPLQAHHDLDFDESGNIVVLTREVKPRNDIMAGKDIILDYISFCDPDGVEQRKISVYDAFINSPWEPLLRDPHPSGDITHTNEIEILDGRIADRNPAFSKGNLLISCRNISTIAVVDPDAERVVWALTGMWSMQHAPTILENGNMLILDNLGCRDRDLGYSRIIEMDPVTLAVHWVYTGTVEDPFRTDTLGSCQRLANGNTLISESEEGRAFEVTPEGEIVWEYILAERVQGSGVLVASLYEMLRIDPAEVSSWLPEAASRN